MSWREEELERRLANAIRPARERAALRAIRALMGWGDIHAFPHDGGGWVIACDLRKRQRGKLHASFKLGEVTCEACLRLDKAILSESQADVAARLAFMLNEDESGA